MPKPKTGIGRGGKPIPRELNRLRGNPRHAKMGDAPSPSTALATVELGVVLPAPDWCDEYGKEVWTQLWNAGRRFLSDESDLMLMSLLVEKLQLAKRLRDHLGDDLENRWYTTKNGQTVSHPAVKQIDQCDAQITAWMTMLGFPVTERARLGLFEIRVADELDKYRKRKDGEKAKPTKVKAKVVAVVRGSTDIHDAEVVPKNRRNPRR